MEGGRRARAAPESTVASLRAAVFHGGALLRAVMRSDEARGGDSKTFVDRPLRGGRAAAVEASRAAAAAAAAAAPADYVRAHFGAAGSDVERAPLADYRVWEGESLGDALSGKVNPRSAGAALARHCHAAWPSLCVRAKQCVSEAPANHTLLPLPKPAVVPGDRFRESYYWDSYWIALGLVISGAPRAAADVAENLISLVEAYGFVPNGARSYYLNRSQPPLLSELVTSLWQDSRAREGGGREVLDTAWLARAVAALKLEHAWLTAPPRQVTLPGGARLCRYWAATESPRPESYAEDAALAAACAAERGDVEARSLMREVAATAASGWDFSARWFANASGGLRALRTTRTLAADLNGFMLQMERNLAALCAELGDVESSKRYATHAEARRRAIDDVLWCESRGCWRDAVLVDRDDPSLGIEEEKEDTPSPVSASDYVPLWCGVAVPGSPQALAAVRSFASSGLLCRNGCVTTLAESGQQWDFPNVWPPLQHMLAEGLANSGHAEGEALGASLARRWLRANATALARTGQMHEKLDALAWDGKPGGGGEYEPQVGFGWTNGVVLRLLERFGWQDEA